VSGVQVDTTAPPGAGVTGEEPAAAVYDLVKRYGRAPVNAVDGVTFTVRPGEVFGLLGPNGAGKTTTIGVLTTRVRPTAGRATVGGVDVVADPVGARGQIAVVPQRSNLDRSLSIRDNLIFHAAYHGVSPRDRARRADELLDQFGLLPRANSKPDFFSGGESQRVMIARALMHAPRVLFLDEPSTGLDPAARLFVWDRLRDLKAAGVTQVLTTHDMYEAAALADRIGIMDHGKLLALDRPAALVQSLPGSTTLDLVLAPAGPAVSDLLVELSQLPAVERLEELPADPDDQGSEPAVRVRLYVAGEAPGLVAPAAAAAAGRGMRLVDIRLGTPTLEDVFIHLTGRTLR